MATFGGGEANVAVSLALSGSRASTYGAAEEDPIGDAAVRALRAEGVRTDAIVRSGNRVGVYYAEGGASQRASNVTYDRANSSICRDEAGGGRLERYRQGGGLAARHRNHSGAGRERR